MRGGGSGGGSGATVPVFAAAVHATLTADATLDTSAVIWPCDASGGAFNATLPDATTCSGRQYTVKKVDASANAVTVNTTGGQTIDGAASVAIGTQYQSRTFSSDGSNWLII